LKGRSVIDIKNDNQALRSFHLEK